MLQWWDELRASIVAAQLFRKVPWHEPSESDQFLSGRGFAPFPCVSVAECDVEQEQGGSMNLRTSFSRGESQSIGVWVLGSRRKLPSEHHIGRSAS